MAKDLPDRIEQRHDCELGKDQRKLYLAELRRSREKVMETIQTKGVAKSRMQVLAALTRLRQICRHPTLVGSDYASGKTEALFDLLEPLVAQGEKVLVFSQFVQMLKILEKDCGTREIPTHMLTGETKDRQEVVNAFQESEGAGVFLLSLRAAGTGLNLTTASYVVLYDPWWNPAVEAQAIDRTHRIGQTKTVNAYKLVAPARLRRKFGTSNRTNAKLSPTCSARKGLPRASTRRIWNSCSARIKPRRRREMVVPQGLEPQLEVPKTPVLPLPRDNREGRKVARAAAQAKRKLHRDPRRSISGDLTRTPFTALAPMQDVTDLPFWKLMARYGGPDLYYTEYFRIREGFKLERPILKSITHNPTGKPAVAQMIGNHIPSLVAAAQELQQHPVAAIDLNLGCPAPVVYKKCAGGGLLREPDRVDSILGALRGPCKFRSPSRPALASMIPACLPNSSRSSSVIKSICSPCTAAPSAKATAAACITITSPAPPTPCPVPYWPMATSTPPPKPPKS